MLCIFFVQYIQYMIREREREGERERENIQTFPHFSKKFVVYSSCLILLHGFFLSFEMLMKKRLFTREYSGRRTRLRTLTIDRSYNTTLPPSSLSAKDLLASNTKPFRENSVSEKIPREIFKNSL